MRKIKKILYNPICHFNLNTGGFKMNTIKKSYRLTFLGIVLFGSVGSYLLIASQNQIPEIPEKDFNDSEAYKIVRIIDGDTVVALIDGKETKIRLIGVDTPETVHPKKSVETYGKEASQFTRNLLQGESVYLEYEPGAYRRDKYGRLLAYLYRAPDGLFVNLEIIRQGYGHAYTKYPFGKMELFRFYEKKARESNKGLWVEPKAYKLGFETVIDPDTGIKKCVKKDYSDKIILYITKTGSKYHRDGCRYLRKSMIPIELEEAKKEYSPCSACCPQ